MEQKYSDHEYDCNINHSCDISALVEIRTKAINRLIIGNLNFNSLSSKFEKLKILIQEKVAILTITETKLDDSSSLEPVCYKWVFKIL